MAIIVDKSQQHFFFLVEGGVSAPAKARRHVAAGLSGMAFDRAFVDMVQLAVSEVVTNAVRHGGAADGDVIELILAIDADSVHVSVIDNGPGFTPRPIEPSFEPAGGRGLHVVEDVSERWGVDGSARNHVWFEARPSRPTSA